MRELIKKVHHTHFNYCITVQDGASLELFFVPH